MNKVNTIGFFGDSYCATNECSAPFLTYINKLGKHYDAKVVHLGHGGSSVYDLVMTQLQPFIDSQMPDVCVLIWTGQERLFHKEIRNINLKSALEGDNRYSFKQQSNYTDMIWDAAKEYYKHLFDFDLAELQYMSLLHYIDDIVLPKIADKTKIIHMFSFSKHVRTLDVPFYKFKTGAQINPPLVNFSKDNEDNSKIDCRPNHIEGDYKNQLLFEVIKDAIENYKNGKTFTVDKEKL